MLKSYLCEERLLTYLQAIVFKEECVHVKVEIAVVGKLESVGDVVRWGVSHIDVDGTILPEVPFAQNRYQRQVVLQWLICSTRRYKSLNILFQRPELYINACRYSWVVLRSP